MFDIFYLRDKPMLFPHEQHATSLLDAQQKSRTRYCWVIDYLCDYTTFDFLYEPVPWEANQTHVWPSQHQENSGTWLIPSSSGIVDVNRTHSVIRRNKSLRKILIDHGNRHNITNFDLRTRYISDYLGTLKRVLKDITDDYVWVISSVCDYTDFDFTWHPSEWQHDMLHVFASSEQKFGDTFCIHVETFLEKTKKLELLEWFDTIHFVEDISIPRLPVPQVSYSNGSVVSAVWDYQFNDPIV
jgi:hypothetical protein